MKQSYLKIYEFSLAAGVTDADFIAFNTVFDQLLPECEGFISRSWGKNEDGRWLDLVMWGSVDDAKKAGKIMEDPRLKGFEATIEMSTLSLRELPVTSTRAVMAPPAQLAQVEPA